MFGGINPNSLGPFLGFFQHALEQAQQKADADQADLTARRGAADTAAGGAQTALAALANSPTPDLSPTQLFTQRLTGAIGDALGGNTRSSERSAQEITTHRQQLLARRQEQLAAAESNAHMLAERAAKLGDLEGEAKYRANALRLNTAQEQLGQSQLAGQEQGFKAGQGALERGSAEKIAAGNNATSQANAQTGAAAERYAADQHLIGEKYYADVAANKGADEQGFLLPRFFSQYLTDLTTKLGGSKDPSEKLTLHGALQLHASQPISKETPERFMARVLNYPNPLAGQTIPTGEKGFLGSQFGAPRVSYPPKDKLFDAADRLSLLDKMATSFPSDQVARYFTTHPDDWKAYQKYKGQ